MHTRLRIPVLALLALGLLPLSLSAQQAVRPGGGDAQATTIVSGTIDLVDEPALDAFPKVAKTVLNVRLSGAPSGLYPMALRAEDGSVHPIGMVFLESGCPSVIDIEKVETGIWTLFTVVDGREVSDGFLKP
jgi:hypothetical protein